MPRINETSDTIQNINRSSDFKNIRRESYEVQILGNRSSFRRAASLLLSVVALAAHLDSSLALSKMKLAYSWGTVDFTFESEAQRKALTARGVLQRNASVPFDVDVDPKTGRVFVSMPHMLPGSPVSLASIANTSQQESPLLVPYPDWSWHDGTRRDCTGLTSVFRMQIDSCGRLWVVDSGVTEITTSFKRTCPPQLFVFDLSTNKLVLQHRIVEPSTGCRDSLVLNVVVDQRGTSCSDDVYAYIADVTAWNLVVFHLRSKTSWRIPSYLFYPDVNSREFSVAGTSITLMDGVLGLALSPLVPDTRCERILFFHALSSRQEGAVCVTALRNATALSTDPTAGGIRFIGWRHSQAGGQASSSNGVVFFSPISGNSINCWHHSQNYTKRNYPAVETDRELLRFVTSMKVVRGTGGGEEEVWAVANNAQLLFSGTWRPNVRRSTNMVRGSVRALIANTRCDQSPRSAPLRSDISYPYYKG